MPVRLEVAPGAFTGGVGGEEVGVSTSSSFLPPSSASNLLQDSARSNLTGGLRVWGQGRRDKARGGRSGAEGFILGLGVPAGTAG